MKITIFLILFLAIQARQALPIQNLKDTIFYSYDDLAKKFNNIISATEASISIIATAVATPVTLTAATTPVTLTAATTLVSVKPSTGIDSPMKSVISSAASGLIIGSFRPSQKLNLLPNTRLSSSSVETVLSSKSLTAQLTIDAFDIKVDKNGNFSSTIVISTSFIGIGALIISISVVAGIFCTNKRRALPLTEADNSFSTNTSIKGSPSLPASQFNQNQVIYANNSTYNQTSVPQNPGTQNQVIASPTQNQFIADISQDQVISNSTQNPATQNQVISNSTQNPATQNQVISNSTQNQTSVTQNQTHTAQSAILSEMLDTPINLAFSTPIVKDSALNGNYWNATGNRRSRVPIAKTLTKY